MSSIDEKPFPKGALIGAGALIGLTLTGVGAAQLHKAANPPVPHATYVDAAPLEQRQLRFSTSLVGDVTVYDAASGERIGALGEKDGFIEAVLRGLTFERRKHGLPESTVYTLVRWNDGRLSLEDQLTEVRVNLGAFGPDNRLVFERLLEASAGEATS
ncbi:MAG: photosynthetic complex assembly protein PuhC [Pseudomonadota bacterium]